MDSSLWDGVKLMLVGMGFVFLFLTLLVYATRLMSILVARYLPPPRAPQPAPMPPVSRVGDVQLVAAVTAAVQHHRARHR